MLGIIGEWIGENKVKVVVLAVITVVLFVVMVIWFATSQLFPDSTGNLEAPELKSGVEQTAESEVPEVVLAITPEPTVEVALEPTQEEIEEIELGDNVAQAVVRVAGCEGEDDCNITLWRSYLREQPTGRVPVGETVSVLGCYYPVAKARLNDLTTEVESEGIPIVELESYTAEGYWCEVVYETERETVKGMIQRYFLEFVVG